MWTQSQLTLLNQFSQLADLPILATPTSQTAQLVMQGVAFSLLPGWSAQGLRVVADLGEPPVEHRAAIYQRLLELNLVIDNGHHQQLALEPGTGRALLSFQFSGQDAAQLMQSLRRAAAQAIEWRGSYFLELSEGEDAP